VIFQFYPNLSGAFGGCNLPDSPGVFREMAAPLHWLDQKQSRIDPYARMGVDIVTTAAAAATRRRAGTLAANRMYSLRLTTCDQRPNHRWHALIVCSTMFENIFL
jgi:hypothetical protein